VLDLKFLAMRQRHDDAIGKVRQTLARNPQLAYAYYVQSLTADHEVGLRAAKKGLQCSQITPFVRSYWLWRAVEHAADMGVTEVATESSVEKRLQGFAFLDSALEDAKTFITTAPPDNWHQQTMLNWFIILTFDIEGNELGGSLSYLADARQIDFGKVIIERMDFVLAQNVENLVSFDRHLGLVR
jgi:hypothetical protein